MELGILSGPGVLLLLRFLRQKSYVAWSKYVCSGISGSPRLSIYSHPNHAMGIAGLHMCSELGEYVDSDKWGLWDDYKWIVACKFLMRFLQGWLIYYFVYQ